MNDLAQRIQHAESYPFPRPACSYLFGDGGMQPLPASATADRIPVIASGSNASPSRLAAKFGADGKIPVTRATLYNVAVVFAGHFTAYGAIPATLHAAPKSVTKVWITWLTPAQLEVMHRSEGVVGCREVMQRYDYIELTGIDLRPERLPALDKAGAYLARRQFAPADQPIRFAEISTKTSHLRARSHRSTLRHAADLLAPDLSFPDFMARVFHDAGERHSLFTQLTPYTIERSADLGTPSITI